MKLGRAPVDYDRGDQDRVRADLEKEDLRNAKIDRDIELRGGVRLILASPNGTRYYLSASNAGVLSLVAV
jgi:hypothetical protein